MGRFINSDVLAATGQGLLGNNMFAYCGNNPISRSDISGNWWDTIVDVASLVLSIYDVVQNPDNVCAWIGLACDIVDVAIPIVSGLGELSDAISISHKASNALDAADNAYDTRKIMYNYGGEIKAQSQIKANEALDAWDDFLGEGQTSYNKFTGMDDPDRIFSADGTRSIRFGGHEMDTLGTRKAHFHYEVWELDPLSNTVYVTNTLQRMR